MGRPIAKRPKLFAQSVNDIAPKWRDLRRRAHRLFACTDIGLDKSAIEITEFVSGDVVAASSTDLTKEHTPFGYGLACPGSTTTRVTFDETGYRLIGAPDFSYGILADHENAAKACWAHSLSTSRYMLQRNSTDAVFRPTGQGTATFSGIATVAAGTTEFFSANVETGNPATLYGFHQGESLGSVGALNLSGQARFNNFLGRDVTSAEALLGVFHNAWVIDGFLSPGQHRALCDDPWGLFEAAPKVSILVPGVAPGPGGGGGVVIPKQLLIGSA